MKTLFALVERNVKLYFKDKGMFFTSLITPLILLVLYATFLKNVFESSFRDALAEAGVTLSDKILNGCVGGQLVSSLLAVSCITVPFCSNLLMVNDKISGARRESYGCSHKTRDACARILHIHALLVAHNQPCGNLRLLWLPCNNRVVLKFC